MTSEDTCEKISYHIDFAIKRALPIPLTKIHVISVFVTHAASIYVQHLKCKNFNHDLVQHNAISNS